MRLRRAAIVLAFFGVVGGPVHANHETAPYELEGLAFLWPATVAEGATGDEAAAQLVNVSGRDWDLVLGPHTELRLKSINDTWYFTGVDALGHQVQVETVVPPDPAPSTAPTSFPGAGECGNSLRAPPGDPWPTMSAEDTPSMLRVDENGAVEYVFKDGELPVEENVVNTAMAFARAQAPLDWDDTSLDVARGTTEMWRPEGLCGPDGREAITVDCTCARWVIGHEGTLPAVERISVDVHESGDIARIWMAPVFDWATTPPLSASELDAHLDAYAADHGLVVDSVGDIQYTMFRGGLVRPVTMHFAGDWDQGGFVAAQQHVTNGTMHVEIWADAYRHPESLLERLGGIPVLALAAVAVIAAVVIVARRRA